MSRSISLWPNHPSAESSTMSLYIGQEWDDKYETRQAITNWLASKGESWRVEKAEKNRYLVKCDHCCNGWAIEGLLKWW